MTSDDPKELTQLVTTIIKHERSFTGMTSKTRPVTAAAGSAAQLAWVEIEIKQEPTTSTASAETTSPTSTAILFTSTAIPTTVVAEPSQLKPQVNEKPFTVNLIRLIPKEIDKHLGKSKPDTITARPKEPQLKILQSM